MDNMQLIIEISWGLLSICLWEPSIEFGESKMKRHANSEDSEVIGVQLNQSMLLT